MSTLSLHLTFRMATAEDLPAMQSLFIGSIQSACAPDYDKAQIRAWTAGASRQDRWMDLVQEQFVVMALSEDELVGFISLRRDGYVDMLYVHPDFQRKGIAGALYDRLENEARSMKLTELTSDVSITARPFFESRGFVVIRQKEADVRGVGLTNFSMRKALESS